MTTTKGQATRCPGGRDDLSREVYCVLGVPIDKVDLDATLRCIRAAVNDKAPFLISTPNLNFLVNFHASAEFRESLFLSDLCPADGMAIVWVARILGIPIKERVAGADLFEALKQERSKPPIRLFLFGGREGIAELAAASLDGTGFDCIGSMYPGFGSIEEMSGEDTISRINVSDAQFLAVSLGALKGQAWLLRNRLSLRIPVRAHLGAVINFEAGTVIRCPKLLGKLGLEWLWRIKEEPQLWTRYAQDGLVLLHLILTRAIPLSLLERWQRLSTKQPVLDITETPHDSCVNIELQGFGVAQTADLARDHFQKAIREGKNVILDCSALRYLDARFLGLLLMLRKQLATQGLELQLVRTGGWVSRILRLNGLGRVLADRASGLAPPSDKGTPTQVHSPWLLG